MGPKDYGKISACHGCDLLLESGDTKSGSSEFCPRCGSKVSTDKTDSLNRTLAFTFVVLILYVPAVFMPLMTLNTLGMVGSGSIFDTGVLLYREGYVFVAAMVFLTAVLLPLLNPALLFLLTFLIRIKKYPRLQAWILRTIQHLEEWGMVEVYLIGILVTIIKVYSMATIEYNIGFFCFVTLVIMNICSLSSFDKTGFWQLIGKQLGYASGKGIKENINMAETAMEAGLLCCHDCGFLTHRDEFSDDVSQTCPRCEAILHFRKPDSINRTWALVISSIILLIPANLLPIMRVNFLGESEESTIMDGIIYFMHSGEYGIAIIIFTASVIVPLYKIIGLVLVLLSVQFKWTSHLRQKTFMFQCIEFIGRWSMLDIFVIALMTVIVNLGGFTSTHAAEGASFFTGVVLCTMFAATTFDARLIWDENRPNK